MGCKLTISDVREDRLEPFRYNSRVQVVPADARSVEADIFVPCAMGGDVSLDFSHPVRAICGAANNQLACDEVAESLYRKGIVYVPDWVVNGGGLISVAAEHLGKPRRWVRERARNIGQKVKTLLEESDRQRVSPLQVAYEICEAKRKSCQASPSRKMPLYDELLPHQ